MFLFRLLNQMLTFSEISYAKTSITVSKKVSFHVIPVHKKEIKSDKVSYRPNLSKINEKWMYQQLYEHFNSILSPKRGKSGKSHKNYTGNIVAGCQCRVLVQDMFLLN